ncbi:putative ribonuclease H-like domain-containing protein [Tanacetum coccineum]
MEFKSAQSGTTAKLPILKLGEYEIWVIRIKQYFQIQDYALWDVIENGNSWVSVPQTAQENGTSVTKMYMPITAEEKTNKKNDVKARSLLLMALPNEHQLTFSQYPDAKTMFAAIETQFGESLDSIFNRLQKIVSRLAILGVVITQEDLNSKFLSSLPPEWNTHVVVWMNKPEVDTMSIDDLYNNFKIVEQKVKKSVGASSGAQNLAFMTAPSTSSTNDVNTASPQVSTASPNVNTASPQVSTASLSDNAVYAFMVENPNGSNLLHQDLEQIREDDLEAMDLKWQLSLLSMRAKRYYQRTGKKIFINANDTAGYDKSKVECFNCHKMGHFARECRAPRSKEGFDWSDMAEEQVQTNMALMAFSDSENEILFSEEVAVLKREVACKDYEINVLKSEFEKVKQEKEGIEFKIEKFDNALMSLNKLLESQIINKDPEFKGYGTENSKQESNIVCDKKSDDYKKSSDDSLVKEQVSKDTSSFVESPLNVDKEIVFLVDKKIEFVKPKNHEKPVKKSVRENTNDDKGFVDSGCSRATTYKRGLATVEEQLITYRKNGVLFNEEVADLKREVACKDYEINMLKSEFEKVKQEKEGIEFKIKKFDNASKSLNKLLESQITDKSKKGLGYNDVPPPHPLIYNRPKKLDLSYSGLDEFKEPEFKSYGSEDKQVPEDTSSFVESSLNVDKETVFLDKKIEFVKPKNHEKPVKKSVRNMTPRAVLLKTGLAPLNTVRPVNTAHPNQQFIGKPLMDDKGFVDSGCSRHMTGNIAYLSDFKEFDGGYVTFGGGAHGGRISGKGTLKTDSLDFEDVYFVSELKFNLFSVSQMCDKKNYVLFTDTECLVLSPNFKLPDETQILLKIPRKDNMYSFDMKNIVPKESLTCLVAKATLDESMLWHRRLGHINFKNINKLVKDNLVRGTSTQKEEISQDYIVMPIWKDASYFDSPSKDVGNGEPKSDADDQKQVEDGPDNENDEKDKSEDDSSPKEVNTVGQHVNNASPEVNTGHFKLNIIDPSVNIASSNDQDSPKDMFKLGASHTLEATHVEFFSDEDEPEVDLGNILNSYTVPTTPNTRIHRDHPIKNVIGDVNSSVQTRRMTKPTTEQGFLSAVEAMQEELLQFKLQQVWILVELPIGKRSIGTKWVFKNNPKKSAFLYGTIEEEVYVTQPPGFKDLNNPKKVYKVVKALYGLHQAPRAWYETLANYLLGNGFKRGKIDQTLFIKKQKGDILLVHVYVDDIIFGSTNKELCTGFEKLMKDKFQMSSIGELTFFLGLQVQQKEDGIFISQDKYVDEILKKFNYTDVKSASTPVDLEKPLVKDGDANDVDVHLYRSMIGSLMYLTASRPDIMFAVCACARFQVTPKTSHLLAVKRIFRYLKGKLTLGLWYSRDSPFELVAYTDSDYARATQDRKSTTRGCQFLGNRLISWQCKKQTVVATSITEAEYVAAASCCGQCTPSTRTLDNGEIKLIATVDGQEKTITEASVKRHLKLADADVEAITKEMHDGLGRATTTASSLEAEQSSGNISKTQTKATPSRPSSPRTSSEGGPREGNTSRGGEGSMQLLELMEIYIKLSDKVTALDDELRSTKAVYNKSLITLTKRVKKLENMLKLKRRSTIVNSSEDEEVSLDIEDPSNLGRMMEEIDQDENVNLVKSSKHREAHETAEHKMESDVDFSNDSPQNDDDELTLAETLLNIKRSTKKYKGKAIIQEQEKYDFKKALEFQKQLDEREEVVSKSSQVHDIDWSDHAVIRYHTLQNRSFSVAEQSTEEEKEKKKDEESSKQVEEETV